MTAMNERSDMPSDVTPGEMWRLLGSMQRDIEGLVTEVKALPAALSKELDERSAERTKTLRDELLLRLGALEKRVSWHDRIIWAVIGFVFLSVGAALLALIIHA